ncbi:cell wall hydrolase [Desulfoscipio gibsoniae]|uniref:cell wall hydrolase n=1 Tax=Desulfoscipio gibsoniae TaxID=102134 RepID=UPI000232A9A7|nr:cell wall hydrolase [Desulfoscipio gibsoniae]
MAGACLPDKSGLSEFNGLDSVDLLARLIYSEAEGESLTGKRGVYWVVVNRKAKNSSEFGGNTVAGVVLKDGAFVGMTTSKARCPNTNSGEWSDSLSVAKNGGTNPIRKCLWFNTNDLYNKRVIKKADGYYYYTFDGGRTYKKVTDREVIGNHTFFLLEGY